MSFEWKDLLRVVAVIEKTATQTSAEPDREALIRSAYNRLYYTVFNTAKEAIVSIFTEEYRDFLKEWRKDPNNRGSTHEVLAEYCIRTHPPESLVYMIGNYLHQMKPSRTECDYQRPLPDTNLLLSLEDYKEQANSTLECVKLLREHHSV